MRSQGHFSLVWVVLVVKKLLKALNDTVQSDSLGQMNRGFSIMARSTGWKVAANVVIFVFSFKGIFLSWNHQGVF